MRRLALALLLLIAVASGIVLLTRPSAEADPATFTVDSTGDGADSNTADGVCDDGSGNCTLRAAIEQANADAGTDTIEFDIAGAGPHTIQPASALPIITDPVIIDGSSEPDFAGTPIIELDGTNAGANVDGLNIAAGSSTVRGLVINRFGGNGIELSGSGGNTIEGNYIGTDVNGTTDLGNDVNGVRISESPGNTVGGTATGARNVISGNDYAGVEIRGGTASSNTVVGNYIGTDVNGTAALRNWYDGVYIFGAPSNTIGGTAGTTPGGPCTGACNLISGNGCGVSIYESGATGSVVQGNFIGTDKNGTAALGNTFTGVTIMAAPNNTIGGTAFGAGNVISGNGQFGVDIFASGATGNVVQGNYIGTDVNGTADLGNWRDGVHMTSLPSNNAIGGAVASAGNTIAFNGGHGVYIQSGTSDLINTNSIHSNTGLGIELWPDGVTPNDPGDGDTGANNLQNFPVLALATSGSIAIEGTLSSTPNMEFRLEFFANTACDPSGYGEGESFLGSATVVTDGSGNKDFQVSFPATVPVGQSITATATDPGNNTSEFSECITVETGPPAVGGMVEMQVGDSGSSADYAADSSADSSAPNYIALAGLAVAVVALTAGAWYARRRWLG